MKISETSIRRPVLASMFVLAMVVFGAVSYTRIGVDLYPDVDIPIATVTVTYPGVDPDTIETEITDVIEEAVNTISGIKALRSQSLEGISQVFVEFELGEDINIVSQDVRDKVATIRRELPDDIDAPVIEKFDLDSSPIMSIVLSGPVPVQELTQYAEDDIKNRIESVSGVGSVRLVGDRKREVRIWLRVDQLQAHGLAAQDVINLLNDENMELPGGRVETPLREIIVKTKGKMESVEDFAKLVVVNRGGTPIRLRDIAWVEDGMEDYRSVAQLNGKNAVSLLLRRQSGTNTLAVAQNVKLRLETIRGILPPGYELTMAQDLSIFIDQSISEARGELVRGGVLAVIVILIFLRSVRGAFVAAITIPTTIISTIALMAAMDFTLNMMSMLALTVSVGMVIDDSIVVLENTYRHMEEGMSRMQAAFTAMNEIGFAVIATSLAILAVFVPVGFMDGIVGQFFFQFGLTVSFAVLISTLIAVTLSPMLCSRLLKVTPSHNRAFNFVERIFTGLERVYRRTLQAALRYRLATAGAAILIFIGSLGLTRFLGQEFVPNSDEDQFNVQVQTQVGTSIYATRDVIEEIERRVALLPGVTETFSTIGSGMEERVNVGTVLAKLVPKEQRTLSQFDIMLLAREKLADLKHLDISVEVVPRISAGGESAAPLQYALQGSDLHKLDEVSEKIMERMRTIPGIVDINSTYDDGKPEAVVRINREKASDLGISAKDLGNAIYALIGGRKVGKFEEDGETYDVRVRLAQDDRNRSEAILRVPVRTRSGKLVELGNLVDVSVGAGPVQIDREDRQRKVTIVAGLEPTLPLQAAVDAVTRIEQEIRQEGEFPDGVQGKFVGEAERMAESFASINFTLMLAVVLVYMVLAAQFESLVHPFTVMLSLPLSIVGALGLLTITGRTLNIFSMIGMIMLMGLVTKNAILLIDYTNLLRSRGMDREEALLQAGPVRLRPILMTAMSTIAGMIPVVIGLGSGAETRAPMGTCIVGGMITSTVLTLVVIPVVYSLMDDLALGAHRLVFGAPAATVEESGAGVPPAAADHPPQLQPETFAELPIQVDTVQLVRDDCARS